MPMSGPQEINRPDTQHVTLRLELKSGQRIRSSVMRAWNDTQSMGKAKSNSHQNIQYMYLDDCIIIPSILSFLHVPKMTSDQWFCTITRIAGDLRVQ